MQSIKPPVNINRQRKLIKYCRKCGVKITSVNIYTKCFKESNYVCKDCLRKESQNWQEKNRVRDRELQIISDRKGSVLLHNGKYVFVNKRQYPTNHKCELCNIIPLKRCLTWHHWDDSRPEIGLWIDYRCHRLAESVEHYLNNQEFVIKYLNLKKEIENV